jgi:hypothetical protein
MDNSSSAEIEIFLKKRTFQMLGFFYLLEHVFIVCDTIFFLWCYSECISTPGKLEKYAWPRRRFDSHRGQAYFSSLPGVDQWIYTQSNIQGLKLSIHMDTKVLKFGIPPDNPVSQIWILN